MELLILKKLVDKTSGSLEKNKNPTANRQSCALVSIVEINYIISGNIQRFENKLRSHTQLIDCNTGIQLWSCMYEGEFNPENIF